MTCRYCNRQHDPGILCRGVSRRAFFFFGAAAAVAPFVPADTSGDWARSIIGRDFNGVPVLGELEGLVNQLARGLLEQPGMPPFKVNGIDLSEYIKTIDLDAIHRRLEAGEDLGLQKLDRFDVTLTGFWEGAKVGKG